MLVLELNESFFFRQAPTAKDIVGTFFESVDCSSKARVVAVDQVAIMCSEKLHRLDGRFMIPFELGESFCH